jgi:hypothetical protein
MSHGIPQEPSVHGGVDYELNETEVDREIEAGESKEARRERKRCSGLPCWYWA